MATLLTKKTIEDILSTDKSILAELLKVNSANLSLIARQKIVSSGKLDLLYLYECELILIELKIVPFYDQIISQINGYYADLVALQVQGRLINAPIRKVVVVTTANTFDASKCEAESIELITYDPETALVRYFENFKQLSYFLTIKSGDFGVVRIALLLPTVAGLALGKTVREISAEEAKSIKTITNRLSVAEQLNLVVKQGKRYFLTDFGISFL